MKLNDIRQEYLQAPLEIENFKGDPIRLLKLWYKNAIDSEIALLNAITLSTVGNDGYPNSRVVLAKEISDEGLIIYTDYDSQKGKELESNNKVSLVIFWKEHDRQIRIKAKSSKITKEKSDEYFRSRPIESQISATASDQSSLVDIDSLKERVLEITEKSKDLNSLPCPANWGGYFLEYTEIEFWQGRPSRLHDRFKFVKENGSWTDAKRLSP
jgi:pyridoxamine 5'-phosphate oxidase